MSAYNLVVECIDDCLNPTYGTRIVTGPRSPELNDALVADYDRWLTGRVSDGHRRQLVNRYRDYLAAPGNEVQVSIWTDAPPSWPTIYRMLIAKTEQLAAEDGAR